MALSLTNSLAARLLARSVAARLLVNSVATDLVSARPLGEGQASMHDFCQGTARGAAEILTTTKTTARKAGEGQASMHDFRQGTAGGAAEILTTTMTTVRSHTSQPQFPPGGVTSPSRRKNRRWREDDSYSGQRSG